MWQEELRRAIAASPRQGSHFRVIHTCNEETHVESLEGKLLPWWKERIAKAGQSQLCMPADEAGTIWKLYYEPEHWTPDLTAIATYIERQALRIGQQSTKIDVYSVKQYPRPGMTVQGILFTWPKQTW